MIFLKIAPGTSKYLAFQKRYDYGCVIYGELRAKVGDFTDDVSYTLEKYIDLL